MTVHALRRQLREQRSMTVNQLGVYRAGVLRRLERHDGRTQIWNTAASSSDTGAHAETLSPSSVSDGGSSAIDSFCPRRAARRCEARAKPGRPSFFFADRGRIGAPLAGTDRGRRAVRVLGILFAVFVVFYLPFFAAYIVHGTCQSCQPYISPQTITAFEWLQYSGSMVNPIVYHVFNPDFRRAFIKILRCR